MEIYSVLTHIMLEASNNKRIKREFTRTLQVPFLPYHLNGKRFYLTFMNKHKQKTQTAFEVKYVIWDSDETVVGEWRMCISASDHEELFHRTVEAIESDILNTDPIPN